MKANTTTGWLTGTVALMAILVSACASAATRSAVPPTISSTVTTRPTTTTTRLPPARRAVTTTAVPAPTRPAVTMTTLPAPARRAAATTTASAPARPCPNTLPKRMASTGRAGQLITVEAPAPNQTYVTVQWWQKSGGCWIPAGGPYTGRIGFDGFSDHHVEGQSSTPTGLYGIGPVVYGTAVNPGVHEAYHRLVCGDWWDEDPSSPRYNTFQHVPCGQQPPFVGDSEALWTEANAYPSFAVVDYNASPAVPGAGSAIFIHADIGSPTEGCVSLPLAQLNQLLRWLNPDAHPAVAMGPTAEITRF